MAAQHQRRPSLARALIGISISMVIALLSLSCTGQASQPLPTGTQGSATPLPSSTGCPATPIETRPFRRADLATIPWIQAQPPSSGMTGHLFYVYGNNQPLHTGGKTPDGRNTKILWVIDNPQAGNELEIIGTNLSTTSDSFHETDQEALSPPTDYPSIVTVPTPGCWLFTLKSGSVSAQAIFWVVDG